jgi:S-DNA-T family DNA segregation ATPase FtsK/SpoIIIE
MAGKNTTTKKKTNTTKKATASKNKAKKTSKNSTQKNSNTHYEIKLILMVSFTVLSIFSLHTQWMGFVGSFIKNMYFGLFSYAGYGVPYFILVFWFYKANQHLAPYRKKGTWGLALLFSSLLVLINILNFEMIKTKFIDGGLKILSFEGIKTLYTGGIDLEGSGLIGSILGYYFEALVGIPGLYITIFTLWVLSFILLTNIKITEKIKNFFHLQRTKTELKKEARLHAKETYEKESEKLSIERQNSEAEKLKEKERVLNEHSQEVMNKALDKVDKKLRAEERDNKEVLDAFDAMFVQSPTRSFIDKVFKKTPVPSKEALKKIQALKLRQEEIEKLREDNFSHFDSKGYAFDDEFESDQCVEKSPDIFENHLESSLTDEELNKKITGFGTLIEDSINKAYTDTDLEKKEKISSFDEAFLRAEEEKAVQEKEVDFSVQTPMSIEEKQNVGKFDQITKNVTVEKTVITEKSQIPDEKIVQHMSERVKLEFENYKVPKIHLLNKNKALINENKHQLYENASHLEEILSNFNVDARVIEISKGPAITRYEIELKPGTKMSKITNLSDDIALHLATQQVRIAPVPNKAAVGIEVPNESTSIVTLREVLDSSAFLNNKSKLSVGLGKNISGAPIVADLAKMPHMLIAGATGSGKSVCVNTLITSILLNSKPNEVKFLMIDPKVVELNNYNGIPHLILPVVTDPKKASVALNWAVQEMTRRYNEFADSGSRDLTGYNKKFGDNPELFMPQIVVIIDELADLMMVAPNQVEDAICRLAQMARAAGIHLIVATQRPSVDVITGVIKANIPSRIAFAVSSAIDSRTIIDMSGAEKLLGKGDMLYYPVGSTKPQRVQGAFISEEEVEKVVNAVKNQFDAFSYDEDLLEQVNKGTLESTSNDDVDEDEHLNDAIRLVVEMEQASISMLQRKFKIGYNRAARLVDEMEARGIVGPSLGSKPRNVLISSSEING